jgi:hypothetical protein
MLREEVAMNAVVRLAGLLGMKAELLPAPRAATNINRGRFINMMVP